MAMSCAPRVRPTPPAWAAICHRDDLATPHRAAQDPGQLRCHTLAVTVEEQQLIVRGKQGENGTGNGHEHTYLHHGIAARPFQRSFVLAEHVEIEGASLERGLLHIDLIRRKLETVVQSIKIEAVE